MSVPPARVPPERGTGVCGACRRYTGPALDCPFCGAPAEGGLRLAALRTAALAVAVLGVALLWAAARDRPAPRVRVAQIGATMNAATVRVEGAVARTPFARARNGRTEYASFPLDDGTGEVTVVLQGSAARAFPAPAALPRKGARVAALGRVDVSGERLRLFVPAADCIEVLPPAPRAGDGG